MGKYIFLAGGISTCQHRKHLCWRVANVAREQRAVSAGASTDGICAGSKLLAGAIPANTKLF